MGWRPRELEEQVRHPREFIAQINGYLWREARSMDRAAFVAWHIVAAAGAAKKKDGSELTLEDMCVFEPLVKPRELSEAEQEELEAEATARRAKAERARMQLALAMQQRDAIVKGHPMEG